MAKEKVTAMRAAGKQEGKQMAVKSGITVHTGKAEKKKEDKGETSRVDAAAIAAKKKADEEQYKKNQESSKKKKLSPLDIAMGRR